MTEIEREWVMERIWPLSKVLGQSRWASLLRSGAQGSAPGRSEGGPGLGRAGGLPALLAQGGHFRTL
jgi:hypothetical protein